MKVGFVSLVGRPNVGKSTLLNQILGLKLAITSNVSGTTRNIIQGIYNDEESQIIFVDTPGIHKPINKLGNVLNTKSYQTNNSVDIILLVIDATSGFGKGDQFVLNRIKENKVPIFLILNKIDLVKDKTKLLKEIEEAKEIYNFQEIIPISAKKGNGTKDLIQTIKRHLEDSDKIYEEDELTNVSMRFIASEFVREKCLEKTHEEIPHTITCMTESFEEKDGIIHILVDIIVDRENIRKIIIGKKGSKLKEIGTEARKDLEEFFGKKVYLETYVKTVKNWRDQDHSLEELGLKDEEL